MEKGTRRGHQSLLRLLVAMLSIAVLTVSLIQPSILSFAQSGQPAQPAASQKDGAQSAAQKNLPAQSSGEPQPTNPPQAADPQPQTQPQQAGTPQQAPVPAANAAPGEDLTANTTAPAGAALNPAPNGPQPAQTSDQPVSMLPAPAEAAGGVQTAPFVSEGASGVQAPSAGPNLIAFVPNGWSYPIVPSSVTGTTTLGALYAGQPTYIDWSIINMGDATPLTFHTCLYLDGSLVTSWYTNGLGNLYYVYVTDYSYTLLSPGSHTLGLMVDCANEVAESNESDNTYSQTFNWNPATAPNLVPFVPSGWSYPIVPSSVTGTNTVGSLIAGQPTYIDWSILNIGAAISSTFHTCLYLDGTLINSWSSSGLGSAYYTYITDWSYTVGSSGSHTLAMVADCYNEVAENNESDNTYSQSFTWSPPSLANLVPYTPSGWSYPIVPSSVTGTTTLGSLYAGQPTYIDWAVLNSGATTTATFHSCLYLDGSQIASWATSGLPSTYYAYVNDWSYTVPTAGSHTLSVVVDCANEITESNESDNTYSQTFTWNAPSTPNLVPYTPSGWSYPIVPSSVTGTTVLNSLYAGQPTYIDWAVLNSGATTTATFHTCLYLDGSMINSWASNGLPSTYYAYINDWSYTLLSAGSHTLSLTVDCNNEVTESNESDNTFSQTFTWNAPTLPNLVAYNPSGWSYPIVPSSVTGTNTVNTLYSGQITYIDWAATNIGATTTATFHSCLYLDGGQISSWYTSGLPSNYYTTVTDWSYTVPTAGSHTLSLVVDCNNEITESNEADNTYSQSFTWNTPTGSGCYITGGSPADPAGTGSTQDSSPRVEVGKPTLPAGVSAIPPSPDLIKQLVAQGYSQLTILDMTKNPPLLDAPQALPGPVTGVKKALVLLVAFPNMKMSSVSQPSFYNNLLFSDGTYTAPGSMRDFYQANSYNQFDVQGATANCVVAPNNSDYYAKNDGVHNRGFGPYPTNAQGLVVNTVQAADALVNFADYAVNGTVEGLFVIHAGMGAEVNYPSDYIWSHSWSLSDTSTGSPGAITVDGVQVNGYTMEPEFYTAAGDSTMGVFAHEYGHALGLPDLYDTGSTNDSQGIGRWSLMAGGSWNGTHGSSPANLDAWSKVKLGWITPTVLTQNLTGVSIPPSNSSATAYKLWTNGSPASEYFLVENRQQAGFDAALPGSGLLIWHIDDSKTNNQLQCTQNNNWLCGSSHYWVALEQADGLYGLENNNSSGDSGDPFPGTTNNHTFNFTTAPNSSSYAASSDTLVRVSNITTSGLNILADLSVRNAVVVPNDDFGAPYVISSMPYTRTQDVSGATTASDDPTFTCVSGQKYRSVWYRYTPSVGGTLNLDTLGSNFDTSLGVWTGSRGSLVSAGCNDDSGSVLQSALQMSVTAGTVYYIEAVAYGSGDATPTLTLNASFTPTTACYSLTGTVSPSGSGTITANVSPNCPTDSAKFTSGTVVQLTAAPTSGYTFSSWSGDASGTANPVSVTMSADRSVTANFTASSGVVLALNPASATGAVGQNFSVAIEVRAGSHSVDGAAAYLNFNPSYVHVVSITPGTSLTAVLQNSYDNSAGQISFAAGSLSSYPSGTFTLATVTFSGMAATTGTPLTFNGSDPRKSDVTYGGVSILTATSSGTVVISSGASVTGSVTLQGRPAAPDASWSIPLVVTLSTPGGSTPVYTFNPTTDTSGHFTLTGITPGTYDARVKNSHTLRTLKSITVAAGSNTIDFGTLREGDGNNDNQVSLTDFSILASSYGKCQGTSGYDARADFNNSTCVTLSDFSLLATNFGAPGDSMPAPVKKEQPQAGATVVVVPSVSHVSKGQVFTVTVQIQAGSHPVDAGQASLDFDPSKLHVKQITGNTAILPMVLQNQYDNTAGTLDFAAGTISNYPSGTFTLVEVQFEAMAESTGTDLIFHNSGPRATDVTYGGSSILVGATNGGVVIGPPQNHTFYVPQTKR